MSTHLHMGTDHRLACTAVQGMLAQLHSISNVMSLSSQHSTSIERTTQRAAMPAHVLMKLHSSASASDLSCMHYSPVGQEEGQADLNGLWNSAEGVIVQTTWQTVGHGC